MKSDGDGCAGRQYLAAGCETGANRVISLKVNIKHDGTLAKAAADGTLSQYRATHRSVWRLYARSTRRRG